jgi:hypothetical protein
MASSGMLRRAALVRTDISKELSASIIRVKGIDELGTTLAATSNRRKLRRFFRSVRRLLLTAKFLVHRLSVRRLLVTASVVPSSLILVTLMKEALSSSETSVL